MRKRKNNKNVFAYFYKKLIKMGGYWERVKGLEIEDFFKDEFLFKFDF